MAWPLPGGTAGYSFANLLLPHRTSEFLMATGTVTSNVVTFTPFNPNPQNAPLSHLRIVGKFVSSEAAETDTLTLQFNGDAAAHYDLNVLNVADTTVTGVATAAADFITLGTIPGASATAGIAGILDLSIPFYTDTALFHNVSWTCGYTDYATAAADGALRTGIGTWRSEAAITSIVLAGGSGDLTSACYALLYGSI